MYGTCCMTSTLLYIINTRRRIGYGAKGNARGTLRWQTLISIVIFEYIFIDYYL